MKKIQFPGLMFVLTFVVLTSGCSEPPKESADTVVSTTEKAAADKAELVERAGAPLFTGMGDYTFEITTKEPGAQRYFNQGMILAFAFNHAESIRSFKAAQRLDPACAMCYWGEALASGPNINVTSNGAVIMSAEDRVSAFKAISQAVTLKDGASPKEQQYIDALSQRYNGNPETERAPLDIAYANAMEHLSATNPDDIDAAALFAEALMNTMPWNYWSKTGDPKPDTVKVVSKLENVISVKPDHPLALHLYIHALEASSDPGRAEAAADRLATLVPAAGHLVHMPAHIYWRVGRYHDASAANIKAAEVDEAYIAACNAQGFYPALYYPHNIHFLWAASTMEGRSQLSIESAQRVAKNVSLEQISQFPTVEFFKTIPLLSYVRFGKWDEILATGKPPADLAYSEGIWHYVRGVAFARTGKIDAAKFEQTELAPIVEHIAIKFLDERDYPASLLLNIANNLLLGEIAVASGQLDAGIMSFSTAVALQDSLPYTEPPFWYYPTRQSLGEALLKAGKLEEAQAVYRSDLEDYPRNGWSMFGLAQSLKAQGKTEEAAQVMEKFETVWQMADFELSSIAM